MGKKRKLKVKEAKINRSFGGTLAILIFLIILGLFMIMPIILTVNNAFKPIDEITIFPPEFFVKKPTFENFVQLNRLTAGFWVPISRYIFNSVFVTVTAVAGHILFASMAAYPIAKHKFLGKNLMAKTINWALLFNGTVIGIPLYIIMSQLHLINNPLSLILPVMGSAIGIYLMINFMGQFEDSIIEAARIDGAGEFGIYWKIIMPNMRPAWITAMIFAFQTTWASNGGAYIYEENLKLLPSVMLQIQGGGLARMGATAAASLLMLIPPLLLFYISQNFVIETMSSSGMK